MTRVTVGRAQILMLYPRQRFHWPVKAANHSNPDALKLTSFPLETASFRQSMVNGQCNHAKLGRKSRATVLFCFVYGRLDEALYMLKAMEAVNIYFISVTDKILK